MSLKVAILISGRGSNMKSLIEASRHPGCPYRVVLVLSNSVEAPGLAIARALAIPVETINHKSYATREAFERELDKKLEVYGADLICLAGFMRVLTPWILERWQDKIVNIHPSLLPAFPGLDTHKKAIESGVKFAGCTVHFAHAKLDHGPIIAQAVVPVLPDDNPETLAARILDAEHKVYPQVVRLIAEGRVNVLGDSVFVAGAGTPSTILYNPLDDLALAKTGASK